MKTALIAIFILISGFCHAQLRNANWCFGDSSGITFTTGSPVLISSGMDGRGSCVSISDSSGQLKFYAFTRAGIIPPSGLVLDSNNQLLQNGDSIAGEGWYEEMLIIPNPSNNNTYYLFSIGVAHSGNFGLYYSIVDMSQNNGLGSVIQKNIQLQNVRATDGINAVKHANGRDWWLIFRDWDTLYNNNYYTYLITPDSISLFSIQPVGEINRSGGSYMQFNNEGNKILVVNWKGLIELLDFDRCTGAITLNKVIEQEAIDYPYYLGCEFSSNGRYIYVVSHEDFSFGTNSHLYQYDLNLIDPAPFRSTIYTFTNPETPGYLRLAPDNKIYLSSAYENGNVGFPYADSMYNYINMNLSVINSPDSLGSACNFTPFSFYLGGTRTYYGLPNNPNYDMQAQGGTICDSLGLPNSVSNPLHQSNATIHLFYHSQWQTAFINASSLQGKSYSLNIFDITGKQLFSEQGRLSSQYFTKDLRCSFASGMYIISLQTEKEKLIKRFIIE